MIKIVEIERDIRFYESMIPIMVMSGAEPKTIKKFIEEYATISYPDQDMTQDAFASKADDVIKRYFGEPFKLSLVGDQQAILQPTSSQLKEMEENEKK